MTDLVITADRQEQRFTPSDAPVKIGRNPDCAVRLSDPAISRVHLVCEHAATGWTAVDQSSQGTFLADGSMMDRTEISDAVELSLGRPDGPSVRLQPIDPDPPEGATMTLGVFDVAATASIDETALRLELDGAELTFPAHGVVRLGRSVDNAVVLGDQHSLVSRHHMSFTWDEGSWWMEDLASSRGTFVDGRPVTERQVAEGAFHVVLGDKNAGTRIRVTTAGEHQTPRRMAPIIGAAAIAVAVLASLAAVFLSGDGDGGDRANSSAQQAAAREATVLVELLDQDANRVGGLKGSGVLISADGSDSHQCPRRLPRHSRRADRAGVSVP